MSAKRIQRKVISLNCSSFMSFSGTYLDNINILAEQAFSRLKGIIGSQLMNRKIVSDLLCSKKGIPWLAAVKESFNFWLSE